MTKDLTAFFAQNAEQPAQVEKVVSKRFKDAEGNPLKFVFKAISPDKDNELQQKSISKKKITTGPKKGQTEQEFLATKYQRLLTIESMVFPNLKDADLQNSYGVMGEEELFNKMLLASEATLASSAAQEANGYETSMEDLVEEAKN